jgi:hypothetical protein
MTEDETKLIKAIIRGDNTTASELLTHIDVTKADKSGLSVALICFWMMNQNLATIKQQIVLVFPDKFSANDDTHGEAQDVIDHKQFISDSVLPKVRSKMAIFLQRIGSSIRPLEVAHNARSKFFITCANATLEFIQGDANIDLEFRSIAKKMGMQKPVVTFAYARHNSNAKPIIHSSSSLTVILEEDSEEDLDHVDSEPKQTIQRKPRFGHKMTDFK